MSEKLSNKPSITPAITALLAVIFIASILYKDLNPSRIEHTVEPAIEIIETPDDLPLTVIEETQVIEQEAVLFVENLVKETNENIVIKEYQDQFVRHDSVILLPEQEHRITTLNALMTDKSLTEDTPVDLYYYVEQSPPTTLSELSTKIEDHNTVITIITENGYKLQQSINDLLSQNTITADEPILYITQSRQKISSTIAGLSQLDIPIHQTVIAVITHQDNKIIIEDIIPADQLEKSALFYVHRVTEQDVQGLWGIIQAGLISTFRQGLNLEGINQNKDHLQAVIPADADEKLPSGLSSFLGKILNDKVDNSYIYNYNNKNMGRDPNIIHPGQQVVLIYFSNEEIKQIYQFFSEQRSQGVTSFALEY